MKPETCGFQTKGQTGNRVWRVEQQRKSLSRPKFDLEEASLNSTIRPRQQNATTDEEGGNGGGTAPLPALSTGASWHISSCGKDGSVKKGRRGTSGRVHLSGSGAPGSGFGPKAAPSIFPQPACKPRQTSCEVEGKAALTLLDVAGSACKSCARISALVVATVV